MTRIGLNGFICLTLASMLTATALAQAPVGVDALWLDDIAQLRQGVRACQASSYERNGGNYDRGQFLYAEGGERVMLDVQGPGCIYRIWMTGMDLDQHIRIYFDNEITPTVDLPLSDFFSGTVDPFLAPLVVNDDVSSGGFICYLPMPFREGCKVTTGSSNDYYNVTYHRYDDADGITTFNGTAETTAIRAAWDDVETDPKTDTGSTLLSNMIDLGTGQAATIADIAGAGTIQGLELWIPGMDASIDMPIWDDGRAHNGYSEFDAAIDPDNEGVKITRRLDYGIADQRAHVFVDGSPAVMWHTPGSAANRWLDSTVEIPANLTAGKSSIRVKVSFASSALDWNEFTYWIDSVVAGEDVRTDTLDVGEEDDEAAHNYVIDSQTWEGSGARAYYDPNTPTVTDDGRATRDWTQFTLAIDPNNTGVNLTRRLDYTIADQRATVSVNGTDVGEWLTEGYSPNNWLDSTFEIPAAHTAGLSSINVRVTFISSSNDWNEFYYWAHSIVDGEEVLTDELDVRDTASESAHSYTIQNPLWEGERTFEYYEEEDDDAYLDVIENLRLVARWDGNATPAIDVPIGGFFGSNIGPSTVKAFPVGLVEDRMYCWLPMPFAAGAELQLVNNSALALEGLEYAVRYTPGSAGAMAGLGRLHGTFNGEYPCTLGEDYTILDVTGAGHLVGVVQCSAGDGLYYLEGDERIYVDGSRTPQLYGTGTEDFYNGGWYFNRGRFTLPTHGNPTMGGSPIATDMYRYFVSDLIPFTTSLEVGIEHGGDNDTTTTDIWSVALYYMQDEPLATLTDELDVGDLGDEEAHAYSYSSQTWTGNLTDSYEGDEDDTNLTDDGRHFAANPGAGSTFTVAIEPDNAGVLLRRRLDYGTAHQQATVTADGQPVGTWYTPGTNATDRFRDAELMIPPALTAGKSSITIALANASPTAAWTEYYYWVYSLRPIAPPACPGDSNCDGTINWRDIDFFVAAQNDNESGWHALHLASYGQPPGCPFANNDVNDDGTVNWRDIDPFVAVQNTTCP